MKISFDLDGVFLNNPDFMGTLAIYFKKWGHSVGVLSSRNEPEIKMIFGSFPWDFIIGCPDNSFMSGDIEFNSRKNAEWKAQMIRENDIDIHFDDLADFFNKNDIGSAKVIKVIP